MDSYAESSPGILYVANGLDPVLRFDGLTPAMETAGIVAPLTAPTLAASGHGEILGPYFAYVRFLDRFGFTSNLSPVSERLDANGDVTGFITEATNDSPIVVTSAGHGLTTGDIVTITGVDGNEATNGVWIITVLDANRFELDDSTGDGAFSTGATWTRSTASGTITNATNASPIVITSTNHKLTSGNRVLITGVEGNEAANGTWTITVVNANTFSLNNSTGTGGYTSGGRWDRATTSGVIIGATNATPIVITSNQHGLVTGNRVVVQGVEGNTDANGSYLVTKIDNDRFSLNGSSGNGEFNFGNQWRSAASTITYTNVAVPTDPKITRKQILRNTSGQANTFYVDVDTTDLQTTTFQSTRTDQQLLTQSAQAILDTQGAALANRRDPPPNFKPIVAQHLDRLFYAGIVDVRRGSAQVTFGSATVQGVGTDWGPALALRRLHVKGALKTYDIASVDETNQTLTLTEPWVDNTDLFAIYAIQPPPAERRTIYFSEPLMPEAVSPLNGLSLPEDADEITGLMPRGSFLYILERRHIWKLTFQNDPIKDGAIFQANARGCINNRSWVLVDDVGYLLDEEGIHRFEGGQPGASVSEQIQELFRPNSKEPYALNWKAEEWFHAAHSRQHSTIRWFVALSGSYLPMHALCYNYRQDKWWVEEYPVPITFAVVGLLDDQPYVLVGSTGRDVYALWEGQLDMVQPGPGNTRGTVVDAGILSLETAGGLPSGDFLGAPIVIAKGRGKGQVRRVMEVDGDVLLLDRPWTVMPDATSVWQLGGIPWQWKSSWWRLSDRGENVDRRVEVIYQPLERVGLLDMRFFLDFAETPEAQAVAQTANAGGGWESAKGDADMTLDMSRLAGKYKLGTATKQVPSHREWFTQGRRYIAAELGGVSTDEQHAIYEVRYEGAEAGG